MTVRKIITLTAFSLVFLSSASAALAVNYTSTDAPKAIIDNGSTVSTLTVPPGACTSVSDVNVNLNITHPLVSDLSVNITHNSSGRTVVLFDGSCTSDNNLIALFDDEAPTPVQCPPNGSYRPEFPLSALDGIDAAGTWTLTVTDHATLDTGTLNSWGVTLACGGTSQLSVTISGSGSVNSVPGGIACVSGVPGGCSAGFTAGQQVTLIPSAGSGSLFQAWGGACLGVGNGNCVLTLDTDKSVTAAFVTLPPVYSGGSYYDSLQAAYNAGTNSPTIMALDTVLPTLDFTLAGGKSVLLKGGYDSSYSGNSGGYTSLSGILTIVTGSLTVENLVIR